MLAYPSTRDLNLSTLKRRTLERLFVHFDPRCIFLPRNRHQIVPLGQCNASIEFFLSHISNNCTIRSKLKKLIERNITSTVISRESP